MRSILRLCRVLGVLTLFAVVSTAPARAQSDGDTSPDAEAPDIVLTAIDAELLTALEAVDLVDEWTVLGTLDPRSTLVSVTVANIDVTRRSLLDAATELGEIREVGHRLEALLAQLDEIEAQLESEHRHLDAEAAVTTLALGVIDDALADAAVARYVRGRVLPPTGEDLEAVYTDATHSTLVDVAVEDLLGHHGRLVAALAEKRSDGADLAAARAQTQATRQATQTELDALRPRWDELEQAVPEMLVDLRDQRLNGTVVGLGLTLVTLDAYLTGEAVTAERRPDCGIRWQAIAAIGRVESNHGRDQGGRVLGDGRLSSPFLGPLLDGSLEGTQVVADSDGGAVDGDAGFDRAVGPFQFLPNSWKTAGVDGDGDEILEVQNMYDGAASVGEYLCSRISPLTDDGTLRESFLRYNASGAYADKVAGWMKTYDEFVVG